jgi:hypothetical protein
MLNEHKITHGWITARTPILVIALGHDEEKIRNCEMQAEAQAQADVARFSYDGVAVTYPDKPTFPHTVDHGIQISQFMKLMENTNHPFPDIIFNDELARIIG